MVHAHIAGANSDVCDFFLDSALVSFVWVTVQIKAGAFMDASVVYPKVIIRGWLL